MMRDIPHQATFQGDFPFPPGGIWTRSFPVSTGDHPLWSLLLLGGGAAAAAIGTGDGGWGLPKVVEKSKAMEVPIRPEINAAYLSYQPVP